jgi:antagonist of KipI
VLEPGLLTTVQDLGRPGLERFGVSRGGAADRGALILGNQLVGNDPDAAGLEMTLAGPRLRFNHDTVVALTGADLGAVLNGDRLPRWQPVLVRSGEELGFGAPAAEGARAYLCAAGGLVVPEVLSSRATDLTGRFGGVEGRPLRAGDELPVGTASSPLDVLLRRHLNQPPPDYPSTVELRVVLGPQEHRFTKTGLNAFLDGAFAASTKADRMGVRLTGPEVELSHGADMLSEGIAPGSIQVPGDGQPIALLTPRQTVGGYPKIATIISADLDRLAQVRPGNRITFTAIDAVDARTVALAYHDRLGDGAIVMDDEGEMGNQQRHGWDPDGVIRVIDAAQRAGVTTLRLEVEGVVVTLERGANGGTPQPQNEAAAPPEPGPDAETDIVRAPMLGIFYRKPSPDEPPFVEVGDKVEAGQTLGLIEVMKTYNEVTAPVAGTVEELIAEDSAFVEYNEPLLRIAASPE